MKGLYFRSIGSVTIIPVLFVMSLIPASAGAWFGLADDHLFAEALIATDESISELFRFYFNLQPWGDSARFNPSELFGWALETYLFRVNALGWRIIQLTALLIGTIAIGLALRKISNLMGYSRNKTLGFLLFGQSVYLALPFWSETIGRIGAPETFAAVSLSLGILNIANILAQCRTVNNFYWLGINTIALVGFKENLIAIGLCSLTFQFVLIMKTNAKFKLKFAGIALLQLFYIIFIVLGFLPELLLSGQAINGQSVSLSRFVITKWVVIPIVALSVLVFTYFLTERHIKNRILKVNSLLCFLIVTEYFVMAGRLGGHYGFLSSVLLAIEIIVSIQHLRSFQLMLTSFILVLAFVGIAANIMSTWSYLDRTRIFKQQLSQLEQIKKEYKIESVVINVKSIEEYEAVSSITSFSYDFRTKFYLVVSDIGVTGELQSKLLNYSTNGFRDWHIQPLRDLENKSECISVNFSRDSDSGSCEYGQKITWLID